MATLHTSGRIDLHSDPRDDPVDYKSVAEHFGVSGTVSLTQFRRAGSYVPNTVHNSTIPKGPITSSNTLRLKQFYGADNRTYSLSASPYTINETDNRTCTITLNTTNVPNGTEVHSRTTGITPELDIEGGVGTTHADYIFTIQNNTASATFTVKTDRETDSSSPERATLILYTDSSYSTPIGYDHSSPVDPSGDYGTTYFDIIDTSKTWDAITETPTSLILQRTETEGEPQGAPFYIETAMTDEFKVSLINEPGNGLRGEGTSWSISAELDNSFGRQVEGSVTLIENENITLYQGGSYLYNNNIDMATGWPNGLEEPTFQIARAALFPGGLTSGNHYITIEEKGRIKFTEIGAPTGFTNREIYSDWCLFRTIHNGVVS